MARHFIASNSEWLFVNPNVVADEPLTMSCWFYADSITTQHSLVSIGDTSSNNGCWDLTLRGDLAPDVIGAGTRAPGGYSYAKSAGTVFVNTWHHAAGIWRANNDRSAYLDGGKRGDQTTARAAVIGDDTCIGRMATVPSYGMNGSIAEVGIWNIGLSDPEVSMLGKGYSPLCIRPEYLVTYLPLIRDDDEDLIGGLSFSANGTPSIYTHPRTIYPAKEYLFHPSTIIIGGLNRARSFGLIFG